MMRLSDLDNPLYFNKSKLTQAKHKHTDIYRYTEQKAGAKVWIAKRSFTKEEKLTNDDPRIEVVAQEFIRLLNPHIQPQYKLVVDEKNSYWGVISEAISGQQLKDDDAQSSLSKGKYKNLGIIQVSCLFTGDNDLRLGNLFYDPKKGLIKIDGDWACADRRYEGYRTNITSHYIDKLPYIPDDRTSSFNPWNWIGYVYQGVLTTGLDYMKVIANDSNYRQEVNQSLLKIILMPDDLIESMIKHYVKNDPEFVSELSNIFIDKKKQLLAASITNQNFGTYIKNHAKEDLETFINELAEFEISGEKLVTDKIAIQKAMSDSLSIIMDIVSGIEYAPPDITDEEKPTPRTLEDRYILLMMREVDHEEDGIKKNMLDALVKKIRHLHERKQQDKAHALFHIYEAFKELDFSDENSITLCRNTIHANSKQLESFSSDAGKFGAWLKQSIFKTGHATTKSDTSLLIDQLNTFIMQNTELEKKYTK